MALAMNQISPKFIKGQIISNPNLNVPMRICQRNKNKKWANVYFGVSVLFSLVYIYL